MKLKPFLIFVSPSLLMVFLFIAFPLVTVFIQSFYVTSFVFEDVEVETCTPTFTGQSCVTEIKQKQVIDERGLPVTETRFVGWETYRILLETETINELLSDPEVVIGDWVATLGNIDFYRALRFTLTFTLITLPFVIVLGLVLAVSVNSLVSALRGPVIFVSLLPFIITPIIGAISIKWLFIGDGILTVLLEYIFNTDLAVFANEWAIEFLMMFYRVWYVAPFAFVVFYAGLQTVNQDSIDSAIVDGANRFERFRFVIIPHLMPLIVFVSLIHLMDAFRVFQEIIGFSSQAYRISLQWLTFDFLTPDDSGNRAISRASASSMLTMIGIIILLIPVLMRTWRDHKNK